MSHTDNDHDIDNDLDNKNGNHSNYTNIVYDNKPSLCSQKSINLSRRSMLMTSC